MTIDQEKVERVATLARLKLTEEEKVQFTEQLNKILQFADKLNELDTENVEPTSQVLPMKNVMRDDVVKPSLEQEKALRNAPDQQEGMFRVPAVMEG